jgi:hypothetical protein
MALSKITTHAADALSRLTQALKNKPKLAALVSALAAEPQAIENALYQLVTDRTIDDGVGAQLDMIGRIVGQARESSTDAAYRLRLRARVKANKSSGTVEEILAVFVALLGSVDGLRLEQIAPASFVLHLEDPIVVADAATAALYVDFLGDAKSAGVGGALHFSYADVDNTFTLPASCFQTTDFEEATPGVYPSSLPVYPSTAAFPDAGQLVLGYGFAHATIFSYTSKTATTFEGMLYVSGSGTSFGADDLVLQYPSDPNKALSSTSTPTIGGKLSSILSA